MKEYFVRGIAMRWVVRRFSSSLNLPASIAEEFLNLSKPSKWYPTARMIRRRVICHVGPTNSGKTHAAMKALVASQGPAVYCAPLRLLAIEMYERLNKELNRPCSLRTGEIICGPEGTVDVSPTTTTACTVEMTDLCGQYEVAVIDEAQMMADPFRGWAFTQAFLGLQAKTIYMCGEQAAVPLIQSICQETGDECEVVEFKRLSPLSVQSKPIGSDLSKIQAGDCVVAFSRRQIFDLMTQIERLTNKTCAVVYGNLPMGSEINFFVYSV